VKRKKPVLPYKQDVLQHIFILKIFRGEGDGWYRDALTMEWQRSFVGRTRHKDGGGGKGLKSA